MALAYAESQDPANLPMAKEILEYLVAAYPNHSWWVRIDGGLVVIKHFGISNTCGMVRQYSSLSHDAHVRRHDVIMSAGELLERAGLPRGPYEEQQVTKLETEKGVKWQPQLIVQPVIH